MKTFDYSDKNGKCRICKKRCKENTGGNETYCQGHTPGEVAAHRRKGDGLNIKECDVCGEMISQVEYNENGGECDHCAAEEE